MRLTQGVTKPEAGRLGFEPSHQKANSTTVSSSRS